MAPAGRADHVGSRRDRSWGRATPVAAPRRPGSASNRNGSFAAAAAAQLEPLWSRLVRRSQKTIPIAHPSTMRSGRIRADFVSSEARASRKQNLQLN